MRGFAYAATINHEVKHFHDALLCRPLFELFLLRNKINWCVAQLARSFRGLSVEMLPLDYKIDHPKLVTAEGAFLLKEIKRLVSEFNQYHAIVFQPISYNKIDLTLTYLIEASAMLLELVNVLSVHGERGARDYYEQVVLNLPDEYSYLLRTFVQRRGSVTAALLPLYTLLAYSLYCSDNPVRTLVELLQSGAGDIPDSVLHSLQTSVMTEPFDREDELKKRIERMQLSLLRTVAKSMSDTWKATPLLAQCSRSTRQYMIVANRYCRSTLINFGSPSTRI